jgi:hypothetical protein
MDGYSWIWQPSSAGCAGSAARVGALPIDHHFQPLPWFFIMLQHDLSTLGVWKSGLLLDLC